MSDPLSVLRERGVRFLHPGSVWVADDVDPERISPECTIHAGCRIRGARTWIGAGTEIGREAPVTLENSVLGPKAQVAGGTLRDTVLLDGASLGSGTQCREGTLLEEEANGAHTVGFKQTILLPFVTTGSLINFCDVLMAGGTSRQDHSEVGSSYIHFNYTPWGKKGDKATASLIGDVPRGVLLDQPRIFLGGQGGLVGPRSIGFGSVLAAGFVYRRDYGEGQLVVGEAITPQVRPFDRLGIGSVRRKVEASLRYIGNLHALKAWYDVVRQGWAAGDAARADLYQEARANVASGIDARWKALQGFAENLEELKAAGGHAEHGLILALQSGVRSIADEIAGAEPGTPERFDAFQARLSEKLEKRGSTFIEWVQAFDPETKAAATAWLESIVERVEMIATQRLSG